MKTISINDFRAASYERKCDVVARHADFIAVRRLSDCRVCLYHAGEFFIEVYYSPERQLVLMIHAFKDSAGLEPYTDGLSLASLGC